MVEKAVWIGSRGAPLIPRYHTGDKMAAERWQRLPPLDACMSEYPYEFDAKLEKHGMGSMHYTVLYVPENVVTQLVFGTCKRLRIDGEINGIRIEAALMPAKGKWYLMVSKKLQKLCGIQLGDVASVGFEIADPEAVSVPVELQFALEANDDAMRSWESWTAGKRRGYCHRIASAKMAQTRERRVEEVIDLLLDHSQ